MNKIMDNITKKDRRKSINFPEYCNDDLNKNTFEQYEHSSASVRSDYSSMNSNTIPTKPMFTCNICNISNSDYFIVLGCNHVFHIKCLASDQLNLSRKCEIIDNQSFFNLIKCNCCGYLLDSTEILHIQLKNYKSSNFDNIYNFGHNADIIFKGKCNGKLSLCYLGGYNVETKCHIGKVCEYDAINKLNISESIFTHKLKYVIENILPSWEHDFPVCKINNECNDCEKWNYIN